MIFDIVLDLLCAGITGIIRWFRTTEQSGVVEKTNLSPKLEGFLIIGGAVLVMVLLPIVLAFFFFG